MDQQGIHQIDLVKTTYKNLHSFSIFYKNFPLDLAIFSRETFLFFISFRNTSLLSMVPMSLKIRNEDRNYQISDIYGQDNSNI